MLMKKADIKKLELPIEYLVGKVIAKPIIDKETGEVLATVKPKLLQNYCINYNNPI